MIKTTLSITNKAGLHARTATKFVQIVAKFTSTVELGTEAKMVDGKNILSIMLLAAPLGSELILLIDGDDEELVLQNLQELSNNRFGEE